MPRDLMKMRRERDEKVTEARAITTTAETEKRSTTADEDTKFDGLMVEVEKRNQDIKREEALQDQEKRRVVQPGTEQPGQPDKKELRSFGDFLREVAYNPGNTELRRRDGQIVSEMRAMNTLSGSAGGFLIPSQFEKVIRMIEAPDLIFRPRATVIPAGDPPDAKYEAPVLDQSGSKGVYAGVTVGWLAEGMPRPASSEPGLNKIELEPRECAGYIDVTNKLLANSEAAGALVTGLLQKAVRGTEERAFMTGDGAGKPMGYIGHPASIQVARTTAGTVTYGDIVKMYAQAKFGGSLVWIINQTVLPSLMTMTNALGQLIWQPSASVEKPSTLLGLPVLINDQAPVLGNLADISLVDLSYYLIKDGSGLAIMMNPWLLQTEGKTRIIAFWNVDGQPWLKSPLLMRDGVTKVSPFITLK